MENSSSNKMTAEEELVDAARMYTEAAGDRGLRLEAILHSVGAALHALRDQHEEHALAPLQYLFAGLSRLAAGRDDPVLKPVRPPGQPGRPAPDGALKVKQVSILLAVEVLVRSGVKKGPAERRVAQIASDLGLTSADGKAISHDMIRNWRSQLSYHKDMRDVASLLGHELETLCDQIDPEKAELAAETLLRRAADIEGIEISDYPPLT